VLRHLIAQADIAGYSHGGDAAIRAIQTSKHAVCESPASPVIAEALNTGAPHGGGSARRVAARAAGRQARKKMSRSDVLRGLRVVCILALLTCGAAAFAIYGLQRHLVFPGRFTPVAERFDARAQGAEPIMISTSSGMVEAWWQPPMARGSGAKQPALIFAHGNGEVIDQWVGGLDDFRRWGMSVLLVEYPGYGRSEGEPSEAAIREAMVGAYDLLVSRSDVDAARIVGYGQSLGGGAICALARDRQLAAMILQSTFTSIRTFAQRYWLPEILIRDPFDNGEVLRDFNGPVLVLHGRHDGLIPAEQAVALAKLSRRAMLYLYDCGHGCWSRDLPILGDIHAFLRQHGMVADPAGDAS
jgi:pimeloyl-ACP methyl ester carboxylesterase